MTPVLFLEVFLVFLEVLEVEGGRKAEGEDDENDESLHDD
jgi:hypothetical protein